jgi:hypothetical protein
MAMNENINDFDKVKEGLQDEWLSDNLKVLQMEPPLDFTKKVLEQIEIKPNPLTNSPVFWILAVVPSIFLGWLALFALNSLNISAKFNLSFLPKASNLLSLTDLSKYSIMVVLGGLFFIGLDYFLNKKLSHRESFFSFLVV